VGSEMCIRDRSNRFEAILERDREIAKLLSILSNRFCIFFPIANRQKNSFNSI